MDEGDAESRTGSEAEGAQADDNQNLDPVLEELVLALLLRDPLYDLDEPPIWFDDANPEPYLELVDLGLIEGIDYQEPPNSGLQMHFTFPVRLTEKGRVAADAIRRRRTLTSDASGRGHVFVSYVREDSEIVDWLCSRLEGAGVRTWRDTDQLLPGEDWKAAVRGAIRRGVGFIACFSSNSEARDRSYMREELIIAIEELRQRPSNSGWFLPVLLSPCEVPELTIGAGRTLRDLQFLRLYSDREDGLHILLRAIDRLVG
jgi:hypothetical protein